jgi:REP-associated tyrosine transposase
MSRPLRIEYKKALYHVMNRGNQHQDVFLKKIDCETFLQRLEYFAELFHVEVYCYCLMTNHFHLLLRTNEANLGRFMQSFLTSFTIILNQRNNKSGHLFQGRYKAHLVEDRKYLSILSRYIHLNPVRMKKYENLSIEEKRNILINYKWSSYTAHIGVKLSPRFIDTSLVLSTWGKNKTDKMKNYCKYIDQGLFKKLDNPFEQAQHKQIIGSEIFAEKILREKILNKPIKDVREERALIHFKQSMPPGKIIKAVGKYFNVKEKGILLRRGLPRLARSLAIYLCCQYCTNHTSLTNIGKIFNISLSGLTRSRDRIKDQKQQNMELAETIKRIEKSIAEV